MTHRRSYLTVMPGKTVALPDNIVVGSQRREIVLYPEFASWGEMIGAKSELSDGQIEERQKKQEKFKTFSCFFYALML